MKNRNKHQIKKVGKATGRKSKVPFTHGESEPHIKKPWDSL